MKYRRAPELETTSDEPPRRRTRRIIVVLTGAVLFFGTFAYAATKGLIWPRSTDKVNEPFSDSGGGIAGFRAAPGDERIYLDVLQHGPVQDVITIESITPGVARGPVKVLEIAIAIRRPGETLITSSIYPVAPASDWRECEAQAIADPVGYEVQPGEDVMLAEKLRLTGTGSGRLAPPEIVFRYRGVRYRSDPGTHLEFNVTERFGEPRPNQFWEWECSHPSPHLFEGLDR